jgi:hypothetical protein
MANEQQSGGGTGILPLQAHLDIVAATDFDLVRLDPRARVRDEGQLEAMKAHIADLYVGVEPQHSFEGRGGTVFDCIPVEQQPALRDHTGPIPEPPDLTAVLYGGEPRLRPVSPQPPPTVIERDRHGNITRAPAGTIPLPRVALEDTARFESLDAFFHKYGGGGGASAPGVLSQARPEAEGEQPKEEHRYASVEREVPNLGGHTAFTLYAPTVKDNQFFSLSQHWYTAGSGEELQSVEIGWQVYPQFYKHSLPVLFIFWSSDNYHKGAYNLTDKSFVATKAGEALIGNALSPVSTQGGQQMEIEVTVYLYEGSWWIYCGGVEPKDALGYYPTSVFGEGPMHTNATSIAYGGETCSNTESWPEMGSGAFAAEGWGKAAYHRAAYYFPTTGGSQWATSLTPAEDTPGDYTLGPQPWNSRTLEPPPWGAYFYYGGPGEQSLE